MVGGIGEIVQPEEERGEEKPVWPEEGEQDQAEKISMFEKQRRQIVEKIAEERGEPIPVWSEEGGPYQADEYRRQRQKKSEEK